MWKSRCLPSGSLTSNLEVDKSDDAVELLATGNPQVELMREENKTARGKISKLERMLAVVLESQAALLEGVTVLRNSITDQTRMSTVYTPKNSRTPSPKKTTTPDMLGTLLHLCRLQ